MDVTATIIYRSGRCVIYTRAATILLHSSLGFGYHFIDPQEQLFFYVW